MNKLHTKSTTECKTTQRNIYIYVFNSKNNKYYMLMGQQLSQSEFTQGFDQVSSNLHMLTQILEKQQSILKNTDSSFYNQAISITIQLQKNLHFLHQQQENNRNQLQKCEKQLKKTKQQLKISQIRRQDAQKKLISLQKQYLNACNTILQKQEQVQELREFNKIDISYIPSFEVHLQEQQEQLKQQKQNKLVNSTEIYSEQNQIIKCQKNPGKIDAKQKIIQQGAIKKTELAMDSQKQENKEQKNIYELLFRIQQDGFKQISDISIQNEREKQKEMHEGRNENGKDQYQQEYKELCRKKQKQINIVEKEQKSYEMNFMNLMAQLQYNF